MNNFYIFLYTLLFALIGYLFGSLIFGQFFAWSKGKDLSKTGSTNVGATNARRELGNTIAFFTSLLDAIKGFLPIVISWAIYRVTVYMINPSINLYCLVYLSGLFAVIGHCWPIQFVFGLMINHFDVEKVRSWKGGKGVSTTGGVLFAISPYLGLIAFGIWIILAMVTRYVSIGSLFCMTLASCFIFIPRIGFFWLFNGLWTYPSLDYSCDVMYSSQQLWLIVGTFIIAMFNNIILTYKHTPNILKLLKGKENKIF